MYFIKFKKILFTIVSKTINNTELIKQISRDNLDYTEKAIKL